MYNSFEDKFLYEWENTDFSNWKEYDVREDFIAPLLKILGYSKRTVNNINREKSLELSMPYHRIGRKRVSIDYVPTIRLKTFWIIEAKPGNKRKMDYGDLLQAHLYAIHPEMQVPFIVLTNGWEIRIYDALNISSWKEPFFIINQENCREKFEELKTILNVKEMLKFQRNKILDMIDNTFAVEIDETQVGNFKSEVNKLLRKSKKDVKENARELEIKFWREQEEKEIQRIKAANDNELLIYMDIPTNVSKQPMKEYCRRILEEGNKRKNELVELLAKKFRGRPHTIFRTNCIYILIRLLKENVEIDSSIYSRDVKSLFEELALGNLTYSKNHSLLNALWHLDNISLRLAKKMAMKLKMDELEDFVLNLKDTLATEDLLKERPTVARYMVPLISLSGEIL